MLMQGGVVLESLPLVDHSQIHAIVKSDTLLIGVRHQVVIYKSGEKPLTHNSNLSTS